MVSFIYLIVANVFSGFTTEPEYEPEVNNEPVYSITTAKSVEFSVTANDWLYPVTVAKFGDLKRNSTVLGNTSALEEDCQGISTQPPEPEGVKE